MIILATHNSGKIKEFKRNLIQLKNLNLVDLKTLGITNVADESGFTFEENAKQKLSSYFELLKNKFNFNKNILISEDSGLEVFSLNRQPGIKSARYGGEKLSDRDRNKYLLKKMIKIPFDQRKAQFVCVIAIVGPGIPFETPKIFRAEVSGIISLEEKGDNGFGYDPIFISSIFQKTNAQLKDKEKDRISHRGLAIKKITPLLEKMLI